MTNRPLIMSLFSLARVLLVLGIFLIAPAHRCWTQETTTESEKKSARLSLEFLNINNVGARLIGTVKTKEDRSYVPVKGVTITFYFETMAPDNKLGIAMTNEKGEATLIVPETLSKVLKTQSQFTYLAAIENNEEYEYEEDEIAIWRSHLDLELEEEDSVRWVRFWVAEPDSNDNLIGVEDVEATIYVQRLFGLLPISELFETTDEDGYLEVEFPNDIPGNEQGELTVVARVDDHDRFGDLKISKTVNWGLAGKQESDKLARELWSSRMNAPIYLIIVVNLLLLGIWGTLAYIFSQVFKIKRIGAE